MREHGRRDAQPRGGHLGDAADARHSGGERQQRGRGRQQPATQAQRHPGRPGRRGKGVVHLQQRHHARVAEVERPAVEPVGVDQGVERVRDVVDGHDVGVAEVGQHQRHPPGQRQAGEPGQQRQEVVRAVDLVHLAGAAVPDDDDRPVDPPGHGRLRAHQPLRLELRRVVSRRQVLALVEHVLGEQPRVLAGDGDRGDVVHVPRPQPRGDLEHAPGTPDVEVLVVGGVGGQVVERREVHDVVDGARQRRQHVGAHPEPLLAQVADERAEVGVPGQPGEQPLQPVHRARPHQHVHGGVRPPRQPREQVAAQEARAAGHEVGGHGAPSVGVAGSVAQAVAPLRCRRRRSARRAGGAARTAVRPSPRRPRRPRRARTRARRPCGCSRAGTTARPRRGRGRPRAPAVG